MAVGVLWLFLAVPRVGLQCMRVAFTDRTHLYLTIILSNPGNANFRIRINLMM